LTLRFGTETIWPNGECDCGSSFSVGFVRRCGNVSLVRYSTGILELALSQDIACSRFTRLSSWLECVDG
jgi:hypothetical protein